MLGAAQRESLSLWLPGLGPQVTECDMPPERLTWSPVLSRWSFPPAYPHRPTVRKTSSYRRTWTPEPGGQGLDSLTALPTPSSPLRYSASPSSFLPEGACTSEEQFSPSPVEPSSRSPSQCIPLMTSHFRGSHFVTAHNHLCTDGVLF